MIKTQQTYIIGEIGQNHNGSIDIAKLIIEKAASQPVENYFNLVLSGMNAIKLTKRDLKHELSSSQWNKAYTGPNSFGSTYGEHRTFLELNNEQHYLLYLYAKSLGLDVIETLCAPSTLSLLKLFTPDSIKVASRDLKNTPLIQALAETKIPIILSTGMTGIRELNDSLEIITKHHENISILHCISQYPTEPKNVNLHTITFLKKNYSKYTIGYSDHTIGISTPIAAVALGAKIIEKHITIDRRMKGTDQAGSLGIDGIERMVRDIRLLDLSMGYEDLFISEGAHESKLKLERSIATSRAILANDVITENDIQLLSPGTGYAWSQKANVIGKKTLRSLKANEIILPSDLEQ